MHPLTHHPFLKMNGIGNAIVVVDLRSTDYTLTPEDARAIAQAPDSHFDQLMVLYPPHTPQAVAAMKIFNCDGSLSAACGNGTRCVAWALTERSDHHTVTVESDAGLLHCTKNDAWNFSVDMGTPKLGWAEIPLNTPVADTTFVPLPALPDLTTPLPVPAAVNMGNPHIIFFVEDVARIDVKTIGPLLEHHPEFPEKANISFAQIITRDAMILRVWERGAGYTLACGSGACAAAVAAIRRGLTDRQVAVALPGGSLTIAWRDHDNHVIMTGAVELEARLTFSAAHLKA